MAQFPNYKLELHQVDKKLFAQTQQILHLNEASYFRILLPEILPTTQRVLYLDCDLLILDDVAELYQQRLRSTEVLACAPIFHPNYQAVLLRQFPQEIDFCFNSGVMLLDLDKMRQQKLTTKLLDFATRHSSKLLAADQDVYNIVMAGRVAQLDPKWNVGSYVFYARDHSDCHLSQEKFAALRRQPSIVHFDGAKPWSFGNRHPYRANYFATREQTAFGVFQPTFDLSALLANSSFHFLAKAINCLPRPLYQWLQKLYLRNNFLEKRYRETLSAR